MRRSNHQLSRYQASLYVPLSLLLGISLLAMLIAACSPVIAPQPPNATTAADVVSPTVASTSTVSITGSATASVTSPVEIATITPLSPTMSANMSATVLDQGIPSPDGRWTAVVEETGGSLDLIAADGEVYAIFPAGATARSVTWSPDGAYLLVERTNWLPRDQEGAPAASGPPEIWAIPLHEDSLEDAVGPAQRIFRPDAELVAARSGGSYVEIVFGRWSPQGHRIVFWVGAGAAMRADGNAPWVLDVDEGKAISPGEWSLVNPRYYSWAPDGSAVAITIGGGRSAQANKWLNLVYPDTGVVTTVVSVTQQIPGIVAWSPQGDRIAYAAVEAEPSDPNDDRCCPITLDNPAIAGRRIHLLDPATGEHWRLNDTDAFQDAPIWSRDGELLYYVQRNVRPQDAAEDEEQAEATMALMAADPATGVAEPVPGAVQPAPDVVGYYGQSEWDDLLAYRPDAEHVPLPIFTQVYSGPGFTFDYPATWILTDTWMSWVTGEESGLALQPDLETLDLGPWSGQAVIVPSVHTLPDRAQTESSIDALVAELLATPGPGQYVARDESLVAFNRYTTEVAGRPAQRLQTQGHAGVANHVAVIQDDRRAIVLRVQGDSRILDRLLETLYIPE